MGEWTWRKKIRVTYFVAFSAKIAAVRATEVYKL